MIHSERSEYSLSVLLSCYRLIPQLPRSIQASVYLTFASKALKVTVYRPQAHLCHLPRIPMPIWTLSAVSSFVCYGLWTITSKLTTQYIDPTVALMYVIIGNTITFLVLVLLTDVPWSFYPQGVGLGILTGILQHFAFFFYLVALSKGPLSWVSVMVGLYPALSVLFGTLVLQEALTLKQGVGVGLAIAAVVLIAS